MSQFKQGFRYLLSGFKLILEPGVRLYVIVPLLINTLLFATAIVYGASSLSDLIDWLISKYQWLEWITWLLWPVFVIVSLTVVFFCFSLIANLIGSPFNSFLADAVERKLKPDQAIESSLTLSEVMAMTIKSESQKLLYFVIRALPLLILFVIPMIQGLAPIIWFLFTAWMLTIEYTDYPMGNHDIIFREQRKKLASNRGLTFGFGIGAMLLTMIPVLNFLAMPVAVAGATRMYVEKSELNSELPQ